MTKQDFIQYLSHPEKLNGHSIGDLELLVREYPYFQTGRMLYLKNLHNQESIEYEKNLHITSAYAPSGKVLYNLIKKKPEAGSRKPIPREVTAEGAAAGHSTSVTGILPKLESITVLHEVAMTQKAGTLIPAPVTKTDEFDELQVLEKEMLREAHRTSVAIDLLEEKGARSQPSPIVHRPSTIRQSYSFNDWLKVVNGQVPESAAEEKQVLKKKKNEIIENYILEQTARSQPRPKAEFYSAETMAKRSIQDNETFVSETLATIYLRQGNLPKALRAYEILLVKYPEKIHIFAPLLEKIKNLLKDQKAR